MIHSLCTELLAFQAFAIIPHKDGMANSLSDEGFFLILLGEYERGLESTRQAQVIIEEIGDESKGFYNSLNFILFDRCRGQKTDDTSFRIESIRELRTTTRRRISRRPVSVYA